MGEEGYTVAQLAEIEASLAYLGVELLPLYPSFSLPLISRLAFMNAPLRCGALLLASG